MEMEQNLGKAPSAKEGDGVGVVQLVDVVLRRSSGEGPARWWGFKDGSGGGDSPWLGLEIEVLSEWRVRKREQRSSMV